MKGKIYPIDSEIGVKELKQVEVIVKFFNENEYEVSYTFIIGKIDIN